MRRSISSGRSARCGATGQSCAITWRGTRWPAAGCSIPVPPRRGRPQPERLAALAALPEPDAGTALEQLLDSAGIVALAPFALARNLKLAEIEALVEAGGFRRVGTGAAAIAIGGGRLAQLGDAVVAALAEWHRAQPDLLGPARGALFARLRGAAPEAALDAALAALIADGRAVRDGGRCACPSIGRASPARTSGCGRGWSRCSRPTRCARRGCANWRRSSGWSRSR